MNEERQLILSLLLKELKEAEETRDYLDGKLESGQALGAVREYIEQIDIKLVLAQDYVDLIHRAILKNNK